jgi:hypothetical protein
MSTRKGVQIVINARPVRTRRDCKWFSMLIIPEPISTWPAEKTQNRRNKAVLRIGLLSSMTGTVEANRANTKNIPT